MIYFIILVVILTFTLYLIYKDYLKVLKVSSCISLISGILTFIIGYIIRYFINSRVNFINTSKITDIILTKFLRNSIYLFVISLIEIFLCIIIKYYRKTYSKCKE